MHNHLANSAKISQEITPTAGAAGTSTINGTILDMQGFEAILFVITFGVITSGAVTSIKVQDGDDSGLSDAADVLGTSQTVADTDDEKIFYVDIYKPRKRYLRLVVLRATQNAVVTACEAIQYHTRRAPTTHGTGVSGELHISPADGTA